MERHWRPSDAHQEKQHTTTERLQDFIATAVLWTLHSPDTPPTPDQELQALDAAGGPTIDRHHPAKTAAIDIFGKRTYEVFTAWKKHTS